MQWARAALVVVLCLSCLGWSWPNPPVVNRSSEIPKLDQRAGWSESQAYYLAKYLKNPYWEKRFWVEKTVRILRGGHGVGGDENIDHLMAMPEEQIIQSLMQDARLGDMVIDFNMYVLGFRADTLWSTEKRYRSEIFDFPTAIESAREVVNDGDYFKLLDLDAPMYMGHSTIFPLPGEPKGKTDAEWVLARYQKVNNTVDVGIRYIETHPQASVLEVCQEMERAGGRADVGTLLSTLPSSFANLFLFDPKWYGRVLGVCINGSGTTQELKSILFDTKSTNDQFFAQYLPSLSLDYEPMKITDVRPFPIHEFGFLNQWNAYGYIQRSSLSNSSTNYNRKRGAYILKQFFCDDLVAIGVEDPSVHTGGRHGSEPSCRACHYKLDPMAGFFRNHGNTFRDFTGSDNIFFDDQASMNLAQYTEAWRADPASGRTWEIGYVRSTTNSNLNTYGESLSDLHHILREAPEVKRCLVKRMFEYVVSEHQTVDGGYLDYLTEGFAERAKTNSSSAFKWTIAQLLLSQSYRQRDLDPTQCYDYKPGYDPRNRPPCRVAYLLESNCKGCHSSTGNYPHLNLTGWEVFADGSQGFPHLNDNGQQIPTTETFSRILFRLSTVDPAKRMPMARHMSPQDRQDLYLWAEEQSRVQRRNP